MSTVETIETIDKVERLILSYRVSANLALAAVILAGLMCAGWMYLPWQIVLERLPALGSPLVVLTGLLSAMATSYALANLAFWPIRLAAATAQNRRERNRARREAENAQNDQRKEAERKEAQRKYNEEMVKRENIDRLTDLVRFLEPGSFQILKALYSVEGYCGPLPDPLTPSSRILAENGFILEGASVGRHTIWALHPDAVEALENWFGEEDTSSGTEA